MIRRSSLETRNERKLADLLSPAYFRRAPNRWATSCTPTKASFLGGESSVLMVAALRDGRLSTRGCSRVKEFPSPQGIASLLLLSSHRGGSRLADRQLVDPRPKSESRLVGAAVQEDRRAGEKVWRLFVWTSDSAAGLPVGHATEGLTRQPSRAGDAVCSMNESGAHLTERTATTIWDGRAALGAADPPCWVVESARPFWVKLPSRRDHVGDLITLGETGSQEHPSHVHVVGDVTS